MSFGNHEDDSPRSRGWVDPVLDMAGGRSHTDDAGEKYIRPRHVADVFGQRERMHAIPTPPNRPEPYDGATSGDKAEKRFARKARPIARGVLDYFPDALAEVAHISLVANEQHNPGQPMHWSFGKSTDHADCIMRHMGDRGTPDPDDQLSHTAKVAWRALALLQTELEKRDPALHAHREAQRALAARGER